MSDSGIWEKIKNLKEILTVIILLFGTEGGVIGLLLKYFDKIPQKHLIAIIMIIFFPYMAAIAITAKLLKKIKTYISITYSDVPPEYEPIFIIKGQGIKFYAFAPRAPFDPFEKANDIVVQPICPLCKTPLKDSPKLLGGHVWKCVRCKFKKTDSRSLPEVLIDAEVIAKDDYRKELYKNYKKE